MTRMQMSRIQTQTPSTTAHFAHPPRNVSALGIDPGMEVADFGAGSGAYALLIAETLEGYGRVYAVDIQRDLLRRIGNEASRRGFKNVEPVWADLESEGASKVNNSSLDLVLVSNLLFQVESKKSVLAEARRVLRGSGRLAVIDWSDSFGGMGPPKSDVVTKEKALALAREAGFELQREFPAGAHHYGLIFKRAAHVNI